jgi:hypothetical protein
MEQLLRLFGDITYAALWYICYQTLLKSWELKFTRGQVQNIMSAIHACTVICVTSSLLLNHNGLPIRTEFLMLFSQGYYIYDFLQYKWNSKNSVFLVHHIVSIYVLTYLSTYDQGDQNALALVIGLLGAELSNIPMYITYHFIHQKKRYMKILEKSVDILDDKLNEKEKEMTIDASSNFWYYSKRLDLLPRIEFLSFFCFRGLGGVYLMLFLICDFTLFWITVAFWCVSIYWSFSFLKKSRKKIK